MPHPGLKVATNPHFDGRLKGENIEIVVPLKPKIKGILLIETIKYDTIVLLGITLDITINKDYIASCIILDY